MRKWTVTGLLLLSACLGPKVQTSASGPVRQVPPDWLFPQGEPVPSPPTGKYLGKFKVTYYWVAEEKDYPQGTSVALYDTKGNLIGRFSRAFVKAFRNESAGRLKDGRCISYLKRQNRVQVVEKFLGCGYTLTELKSVAVDPRIVPLGSRLFIPQAGGVVINGRRLTGIFYAHDIGSAIQGKRIDIFIGDKANMAAFTSAGMGSMSSVDVYLLE